MRLLPFFYKQPNYWTCGPAVARLILHSFGKKKPLHEIIKDAKTTKAGTSNSGLKRVLKKHGVKFQEKRNADLADIKSKIKTHWLLVAYWIPIHKEAHYSIIKKIDSKRIYFHDTWFGSKHSYSQKYFLKNWWDGEAKKWLLTIRKPVRRKSFIQRTTRSISRLLSQ
ncbi:MAG: cysteine peptidase family C39 domain-containing protein [bacterium]|nr:cysteine peptidase family C39 domain-containing protein [bacterium]